MGMFKTKRGTRSGSDELVASLELDLVNEDYDGNYFRTMVGYSQHVGKKPWEWYANIGEIHYAVSRGARIAGYARIYACKRNPDGSPGEELKGGLAHDVAMAIESPFGGTRGLLSRYYTQAKIPGDSILVRIVDKHGALEGYDFLCADEIDLGGTVDPTFVPTGGKFAPGTKMSRITSPKMSGGAQLHRPLRAEDVLGRVWRPDARYVDCSDSPMLPLQTECELLHLLTVGLKAKLTSRLALNGILFVPSQLNEVQFARHDGKSPKTEGVTMIDRLLMAATHAVLNYDKPEAAVPIMVAGDKDLAEAIRFITVDRELYETDMRLRQELIDRILMGLDVQPVDVKGMGDSNHWCVTPDTEAFTAEGWKRYADLRVGEQVLTLNHETGLSEWGDLLAVNVFDVADEEMVSLASRTHSSLTTLNHRWPVMHRTTEGMVNGLYRRWRTSADLGATTQVIVAAPSGSQPAEAKWSDDLVELVAWTWTEGSMAYRAGREQPNVTIYQSLAANPSNVARIRRALTNLYGPAHQGPMPTSRRGPKDDTPRWREIQVGDMVRFKVNSVIASHLDAICPRRMVSLGFIQELTAAQLELFIHVSLLADGTISATGQEAISQKNPAMLDALEMAAVLAGRRVSRSERSTMGFTQHAQHILSLGRTSTSDFQKGGISRERYTGVVWCPTTENRTWLARRDGKAFFTGNSAWAVSDDERRVNVQPELETICWAATRMILHRELLAAERTPKSILNTMLWYDLTDANVRTNLAEDARQLRDRILISPAATRRMNGVKETDKPSEIEEIRQIGVEMGDPYLATFKMTEAENIDWDKVTIQPKPGPDGAVSGDRPKVGAGSGPSSKSPTPKSDTPKRLRPA